MSEKEYRLSPQALVMVQGSSKGTQPLSFYILHLSLHQDARVYVFLPIKT